MRGYRAQRGYLKTAAPLNGVIRNSHHTDRRFLFLTPPGNHGSLRIAAVSAAGKRMASAFKTRLIAAYQSCSLYGRHCSAFLCGRLVVRIRWLLRLYKVAQALDIARRSRASPRSCLWPRKYFFTVAS
jgi:hypothetical protein